MFARPAVGSVLRKTPRRPLAFRPGHSTAATGRRTASASSEHSPSKGPELTLACRCQKSVCAMSFGLPSRKVGRPGSSKAMNLPGTSTRICPTPGAEARENPCYSGWTQVICVLHSPKGFGHMVPRSNPERPQAREPTRSTTTTVPVRFGFPPTETLKVRSSNRSKLGLRKDGTIPSIRSGSEAPLGPPRRSASPILVL
jgi:hypothetical protein